MLRFGASIPRPVGGRLAHRWTNSQHIRQIDVWAHGPHLSGPVIPPVCGFSSGHPESPLRSYNWTPLAPGALRKMCTDRNRFVLWQVSATELDTSAHVGAQKRKQLLQIHKPSPPHFRDLFIGPQVSRFNPFYLPNIPPNTHAAVDP